MMRMMFRQRFFSWFDSYDVYDEQGDTLYTVKGMLSWGHCLKVMDAQGRELGMVKEEVFTLLPRFQLFMDGREVGVIEKQFTLFQPKFRLEVMGWSVEGDWLEWDYRVMQGQRPVATISKKLLEWTDTYAIEVVQEQDALLSLMVVLAIDAVKCSAGN